jgi:hypothetical protein
MTNELLPFEQRKPLWVTDDVEFGIVEYRHFSLNAMPFVGVLTGFP